MAYMIVVGTVIAVAFDGVVRLTLYIFVFLFLYIYDVIDVDIITIFITYVGSSI